MDIEEIVRRAQSEGRFRDLPGKGKPLNLSRRQPQNVVTGIVAEAGFAPEWAHLGKDLDAGRGTAQELNSRWLHRKEMLLSHAEDLLKSGKVSEVRKTLLQYIGERNAVACDLTVHWTRDRRTTERYNLIVPGAHQQRTVPSPAHLLRVFLERSPDVILSQDGTVEVIEVTASLSVTEALEEAERKVKAEEGERPRMSSLRAEALIGFKARYGGRG